MYHLGQAQEEPVWAKALKTGAEVFQKVYTAIKYPGYPSPYPQTPDMKYVWQPPKPGEAEPTAPGVPAKEIQKAMQPNLMPIIAAAGGFFLISAIMSGGPRRRR